ncbi:MAG TPA: restriction endonuclease subunit S [Puia sp.]|jgi:type I restriction enzyme S subunit
MGERIAPLGELVFKKTKKITSTEYPDAKFIGMDCIEPHTMKTYFLYDFKEFKSSGSFFETNQVLYGRMRPYLNKVYKAEFSGACSGEFIVMECGPDIIPDFLAYILHSRDFVRFANSKSSGDRPRISFEEISDYRVKVLSISSQKEIVSKIEELFSELDKGVEQLKTAQQQLKTYRQAVLKWAFEGRFTNENVKDRELPKGWNITSIIELVSKDNNALKAGPFGSSLKKEFYVKAGYKIYGQEQVINGDPFYGDYYINEKKYEELITCKVKPNDILISLVGTVGKVLILPENCEPGIINPRLIKISLNTKKYIPLFFKYYFESAAVKTFYSTETKGTTMSVLNLGIIKTIGFPICSTQEQIAVIQKIESRLNIADKMEESIIQSLQQAETLKQSILKKAFEGELVESDTIETIKEPAKIIPLERKVLAGKIIHLLHDDKYFGLTKFQKILYLVENFAEVPYETNFSQERAGPYDKEFTIAFRKEMQEKDWLQEEQKGKITKFIAGDNIGSLIKNYAVYFREKGKKIVFVIQQLKDKSTHEAELIATLYAVWNNRLIKKKPIKTDLLVEDFFNWSAKKKDEFQPEEVVSAFKWMKQVKFAPSGFGKFIGTN